MPKQQRTASENGLSGSTRLRLRNQLERAHRQCFGAEQGLHVLVKLATAQMLATGSSRSAIREALANVASDYPVSGEESEPPKVVQPRAAALKAMMLRWSDRTTATNGTSDGAD